MLKIGINGFGRIGRAIFRNNLEKNLFDVVVINDINPDIHNLAYTLNFDTLYDRLPKAFTVSGQSLVDPEGKEIDVFHENRIHDVNWKKYDVDIIIDASGVFQNVLDAQKLISLGACKKVCITHSPDHVDFTMVLGANEHLYNPSNHHVISTSICDATAIAPIMKIVNQAFSVDHGYVTTLHPWLSYQNLIDGPASSWSVPGTIYHHYALGRSAIGNMIPKPTSAIEASCKVLVEEGITENIIGSFSYRTPTAIVGSADITLNIKEKTNKKDLISVFEEYEKNQNWNIIHNNIEPLVSLDFKKADYSAIVDHRWTDVIGEKMLKLVLWYDNEYGYAARVIDQINYISKKLDA
ncbi:MAG: glyceraldehyde 3-phosphate dehydrogenase NAD-binding domain-containing protein [Bacteroidota bacterium]